MMTTPSAIVSFRSHVRPMATLAVLLATASARGQSDAAIVRVEINGRAYVGALQPATQPATQPTEAPVALAAGPAPLGVHLDASDAIDPAALRDTRVTWDFGNDAGTFNLLDGFNAAHVYDVPGLYTINRTITTPAGTTVKRYTLDVQPSARKVTYVGLDGSDRNDGTTPERAVATFARAAIAMGAGNAEVMFRRGDTFEIARGVRIKGDDVRIGAYGDATKPRPVLATTPALPMGVLIEAAGKRLLIEDVAFDAPSAKPFEKAGTPDVIGGNGTGIVVRRCTFLNVNYGVNGNGSPSGVLLEGNEAPLDTGLRAYLAWIQGSDWTILGNRAANSTREHIVRVGGGERINIQFNDFTNIDRRTVATNPDANDTGKAALNIQKGAVLYVAHNVLNGPNGVGPLGKTDGMKDKGARWVGAVIEDNRVNGFFEVNHGASHLTYRNNFVRADDSVAFPMGGYNGEYDRGVVDVTLDHNTVVNAGKTGGFLTVAAGAKQVSLINNLYVAPELVPGAYASAAVYVNEPDLRAFTAIAGNCWPVAKPNAFAHNSVQYVGPQWGDPKAYIERGAWSTMSPVNGDRFENVTLIEALGERSPGRDGVGANTARLPSIDRQATPAATPGSKP